MRAEDFKAGDWILCVDNGFLRALKSGKVYQLRDVRGVLEIADEDVLENHYGRGYMFDSAVEFSGTDGLELAPATNLHRILYT